MADKRFEYEVALSFAGEDRKPAEALARILKHLGVSVFYDEFEKDALWGKDLFQHLADIYKNKARYCIVFVSKYYRSKKWTKHELQNAQARLFSEQSEYILPIRIDDTELPGLNETVGYLDLKKDGIEQIASTLLRKLGIDSDDEEIEVEGADGDGEMVEYQGALMTSFWPEKIKRAQEEPVYVVNTVLGRIPWGDEPVTRKAYGKKPGPCGDCAVLPGQYHVPSCDLEQCPACGGQALSCDCDLKASKPMWPFSEDERLET